MQEISWSSWLRRILVRVGSVTWWASPPEIRRRARKGSSQSIEKGAHSKGDDNL